MNINSAYPSKFLKAGDLDDATVVVTISEIKLEKVGQNEDIKPVAYFKGKKKGLVLNKTNARKIANIAQSQETDNWPGTVIAIYPTETEFGGDTVECIRVKAPKTSRQVEEDVAPESEPMPSPVTDDDIPF